MPLDDEKMQALKGGGAGRYFGPTIGPTLPPAGAPIEEQLQQPLDLSLGAIGSRLGEALVAPAQEWMEYTPRQEKFMDVLTAATDVFQPSGKATSGASMLFGSPEMRGAFKQVLGALRKARTPGGKQGMGIVGGLLDTLKKGAVASPVPRTRAMGAPPAGSFLRDTPDAGLDAARQNLQRINRMKDTASLWEAEAKALRAKKGRSSLSADLTVKEVEKNATELRRSADAQLKQHKRHLKRLQTHRRRQIEKYEVEPETPEIAIAPRFDKTPDVELHELLHAGEKGMFPGRTDKARELLKESGVGDWLRAQEVLGGARYPEAWTRMPGEQFAESLTAIARGQKPGLTAKETEELGEALGLELSKLRLGPLGR